MFLPLDDQAKGQMDSLFEAIGRKCERLDFALHSIAYAQSGSARQSYGLFARRLPQRHERVPLLIYPHGTARGVSVVMVKSVPPSFMRHHGPRQSCLTGTAVPVDVAATARENPRKVLAHCLSAL